MQISKTYGKILWILIIPFILSSCLATKKYSRPQGIADNALYRGGDSATDSSNMAGVEWDKLFPDTLLQKYIRRALDSNFDIRIAIQQIKEADAYLKQARAGFSPSLAIEPSVQYQTLSLNTPQGLAQNNGNRGHSYLYGLSGNLSWEADIWGKINSQKKAALAGYLNTVAAQQAVKSQLIATIAESYFQLLAYDAQQKIIEETIVSQEKGLETNKALKEAGTVTEVAVKQYEAQVLNAKAQLVNIDNSIRILENTLCILLAQDPQAIARTSLSEQHINTPLTVGVPYQLLDNRPDVRAAEYKLINAFEMTNVARASFYPSLSITASGGLQSTDFDKLFNVQSLFASVIGSLTQPLWNQRKIRSQYEANKAEQQIAYLNYRKTILTAGKEVSDALYNYQVQDQLSDLKHNEYLVLDTATQYSQDLLNNGMATYLDVLTAQQNALSAKLSYINAAYGKLEAVIELYKALGGGR